MNLDRWKKNKGLYSGNLTLKATTALIAAESYAQAYGRGEVAPLHLLLGMLQEGTGLGLKTLDILGVDWRAMTTEVESQLENGAPRVEGEPSAAEIMERAEKEARSFRHSYIGQEHILLALLSIDSGVASGTLKRFGVVYDQARQAVESLLSEARPAPEVKRYNLALPDDLFREVEQLAQRQNTTVVDVLRRFVKLGLYVTAVQDSPDGAILVREGEREREILIL
jgi:ATP-dependent Clp protease ATP-binding subunit ClpA